MTYFWNFGTPSISRERFELETSNLACRLTTGGTNDKNEKNRSKGVGKGSRDLLLKFWDPLHISICCWVENWRQFSRRSHTKLRGRVLRVRRVLRCWACMKPVRCQRGCYVMKQQCLCCVQACENEYINNCQTVLMQR